MKQVRICSTLGVSVPRGAFQISHVKAGALLDQAGYTHHLTHITERLRHALYSADMGKLLLEYERRLAGRHPSPPTDDPRKRYHETLQLCTQAERLLTLARAWE